MSIYEIGGLVLLVEREPLTQMERRGASNYPADGLIVWVLGQ